MSDSESDFEMIGAPSLDAWTAGESMTTTATVKKAAGKKKTAKTVEERYQKKTQIEHILHRPESYIGSVQADTQGIWVWSEEDQRMIHKQITFVPGLYKIFDEILVNAADVKARESQERQGNVTQKMTCIKVDIDREKKSISVYNDGDGIPVEVHKKHNIYVPELIFGHLLTSDNYDDSEERVTGGRNGYGAKLTNIFSTIFTVECADSKGKRKFRKTWKNNMSASDECKVTDYKESKDYVKVTFSPDLKRFQMSELDDDIASLLTKRVYDIAGCCGLKVWLNGRKLPTSDFKCYVDLYFPPKSESSQVGLVKPPIKIHEKSGRWEIVVSMSDGQFQHVSFVNSICTSKGGTHVNYVTDPLIQAILKKVNTKNKGGMELKAHHVKQHLWVFVNSLIVNPTFDSQTKDTLTLKSSQFGSKFSVSEKTITAVTKSEIVESVLMWAKAKQQVELQRKMKGTSGRGSKDHLSGIPKLEDANDAGTKYGEACTLILTEGESAKTSCVAGLSIVGKNRYGVFPLKGKLLNVREASFKQQVENQEVQAILKIMGLQVGKKIDTPKGLRYGSLMIMTDQDLDGSHIKGLLLNMFAHYWPALLQYKGFLKEFVTPIVKCFKGHQVLNFFTLSEYENWKKANDNGKGWKIKYYKGLGTSNDKEFKEYFSDLGQHCLDFEYTGNEDYDAIDMAFNGKRAEDRKTWIQNYNDGDFVDHSQATITYTDFINKELVAFSRYDTIRSIPSCIDGLKPVQRKTLFAAFKRNLKAELKVAQFIGYISEKTAYHHGEQSLGSTIVGMAQNFVGSNNLNLLQPCGQFGSRKEGGKDASAVRYIFTRLSSFARALFSESDDALLDYQNDDGLMVEPKYYIPIIPLVLANGAEGIGTGWSSSVPNYNPRDIIANVRRFIKGDPMEPMIPWYRGFKGAMERKGQGFESVGIIKKIDGETLEITELPVKVWTQNFRNFLEELLESVQQQQPVTAAPGRGRKKKNSDSDNSGAENMERRKGKDGFTIIEYRDNSSHEDIHFTITLTPANMAKVEKEGLEKAFKLRKAVGTTNMTLFDHNLKVHRYLTELDIVREFGQLRLQYYEVRKEYLVEKLERETRILRNKANFVQSIIDEKLNIRNRKKADIVKDLLALHLDTMKAIRQSTKLMWKLEQQQAKIEAELTSATGEHDQSQTNDQTRKEEGTNEGLPVSPAEFEYLLGMSLWSLSAEKVEELKQQLKQKAGELEELQSKTPEDLWLADLVKLEDLIKEQDETDELNRAEDRKFKKIHRSSIGATRNLAKRRAPKAKAKAVKKQTIDSNDDESANSYSSSASHSDALDSDDDPFKVTKAGAKTKAKQTATSTRKPKQSASTSRQSSPPRGAPKVKAAASKNQSEQSPRPLKGFSLADRLKSRNTTESTRPLSSTSKQQTLDELLGLSSSTPASSPSFHDSSFSSNSISSTTQSPPNSLPVNNSREESVKRPASTSSEEPHPPKRARRLVAPPGVKSDEDSEDSDETVDEDSDAIVLASDDEKIDTKRVKKGAGRRLRKIQDSDDDDFNSEE